MHDFMCVSVERDRLLEVGRHFDGLSLARARLLRLTAWATPHANAAKRLPTSLDARGVAHAVKRSKPLTLGRARSIHHERLESEEETRVLIPSDRNGTTRDVLRSL